MISLRFVGIMAMAMCSGLLFSQTNDLIRLSNKPGAYRENIVLSVETDSSHAVRYRFQATDDKERFLPFTQALLLGAMAGEIRTYSLVLQVLKGEIEVERRNLEYVIDRCPPLSPEPLTAPLVYKGPTEISLSLNSRDTDAKIRASYRGSDGSSQDLPDGKSILLSGITGQQISYVVSAYAEDQVHNVSPVKSWTYGIDRRQERDIKEIPIYSPVEGRFQNPQYLYIDSQAFSQIRFSVDGSEPRNGREYTGGVILDASGRVSLRVWGKTLTGQELERRILYEAGTEKLDEIESGTIGRSTTLQLTKEGFHFTASERNPGSYDEALSSPLRITPQVGTLRGLALRLLRDRDLTIFRYYLVLDGRPAPLPDLWIRTKNPIGKGLISLSSGSAVNEFIEITPQAYPGSRMWFRMDGISSDSDEKMAKPIDSSTRVSLADLRKSADSKGVCTLVFQSRQAEGAWGAVRRFSVLVHPPLTMPPVTIVPGNDRTLRIQAPVWDGVIWYSIASEFHGKEGSGPFILPPGAVIELPFGAQGNFNIQFFGVGSDGMVSLYQAPIKSVLSSIPPEEPVITRGADARIHLKGIGSLQYRVSGDHLDSPSLTTGFQPYTEPVSLKPLPGENIVYWFEAQARDAAGNLSAIARAGPFPVHTRPPGPVRLVGGEAGLFRNAAQFKLQIESPEIGMQYHYTIGPEGAVNDPDGKSPWVESEIQVSRKEERVRLELRIIGISALDPRLIGPPSRFLIDVDTRQPSLPKVSGVESGKSYRTALTIEITIDPDSQASYLLRRSGDSVDRPYTDYTQAIRVDAPPETGTDWELLVKTRNRAGSENALPVPIRFRIDTRIPALPGLLLSGPDNRVLALDEQNHLITRDDVRLSFGTVPGNIIHYELSQDQSRIRNPDQTSPAWQDAIVLTTAKATEQTWYFRYRVIDPAGNQSPLSVVYLITVDKQLPPVPPPPRLIRQGNAGELFWQNDPGQSIQYFLSPIEASDGNVAFIMYTGEKVRWALADGQDRVWLYYRAMDKAGNISETASLNLDRKLICPIPQVIGVSQGGLYNAGVSIRATGSLKGAVVRYELGTGDQRPAEVSIQSPEIRDALEVGPIAGETVTYHLLMRQYADGYEASEALSLDFVIDRTPPPPPVVQDLGPVSWLSKPGSLHLTAEPGDTIWYTMWSDRIDFDGIQDAIPEFKLREQLAGKTYQILSGDLKLPAEQSAVSRYIISAYTVDAAGNKSLIDSRWQVFIDTQSVYVADTGMESGVLEHSIETGSRAEPFHDLARAIEFARKNSKTGILISTGKFAISGMINLSSNLFIHGGFDYQTWLPAGSAQTILYPRPGFSDPALFDLKDAIVHMRGLYLIDAGLPLPSLIKQRKGQLSIESSIAAISTSRMVIDAERGLLVINQSSLSSNDSIATTLVRLDSMDCHIDASVLECSDLPPVLLKNVNQSIQVLIDATNSILQTNQSRFIPRRGQSTTGFVIRGGTTSLNSSEIWTGGGNQSAVGLDIGAGAHLNFLGTTIHGDARARIAVLLRVDSSDIVYKGGLLELAADSGVYGILARNANILLEDLDLKALQSRDFMNMFSLDQSQLQVKGARIYGALTPDFRIAILKGGSSTWKGTTLRIETTQTMPGSGLFSFSGIGQHQFDGNNLAGNDRCTLFFLGSPDAKLLVRNNILERWRFLLQEPPVNLIRQSDLERGVSTIQELERLDRQGSLFEGNKIRQGL